jgi:hypothetical protein
MSTHLTAHAFTSEPENYRAWAKGMDEAADLFRESMADATFLCGDINCNFLKWRMRRHVTRRMPKNTHYDMPMEGTFGRLLYDYIMRKGNVSRVFRERIEVKSDHDAVVAGYRWRS